MNHENLAVLLIDMQDEFLKDHCPEKVRIMIESQMNVLEQCYEKNIPTYEITYDGAGATHKDLKKGLDKILNLNKISKNDLDAFENPLLGRSLRENKIKKVYLAGINASACVLWTASGALQEKYEIFTSEDVISDPDFGAGVLDLPEYMSWYFSQGKIMENNHDFEFFQ